VHLTVLPREGADVVTKGPLALPWLLDHPPHPADAIEAAIDSLPAPSGA
jgi:hypothetical protein